MKKVRGLYTALVTPFDHQGNLDTDGLRHNIRFQLENEVDGLNFIGTTGEAPTLTQEEKEEIITIACEEAKGKVPIMVGTGGYSTRQTIENTQQAAALGADIALVISPYYNKPTQEGLYLHFKTLAENSDIPIVIYNNPVRTALNIQIETLQRLAEIPSIIGLKEAPMNFNAMIEAMETIGTKRSDFSIMSGDDALTLALLAHGGDGLISITSNLLPHPIKRMILALQSGDIFTARKLYYHLLPAFKGACIETNPIPIKAAMNLYGFAAGKCRLPLCDLKPENLEALKKIFHQYADEIPIDTHITV